jgi:hypothetical protein
MAWVLERKWWFNRFPLCVVPSGLRILKQIRYPGAYAAGLLIYRASGTGAFLFLPSSETEGSVVAVGSIMKKRVFSSIQPSDVASGSRQVP